VSPGLCRSVLLATVTSHRGARATRVVPSIGPVIGNGSVSYGIPCNPDCLAAAAVAWPQQRYPSRWLAFQLVRTRREPAGAGAAAAAAAAGGAAAGIGGGAARRLGE